MFRKLSVEDNIRAVLQMTSMTAEEQRDKLESLIAEFRLEKVRRNLGDQLSGGERRRTEIARCLAINSTSLSPVSTLLRWKIFKALSTSSRIKI